MNNFTLITPEEYVKIPGNERKSLEAAQKKAARPPRMCSVCEVEHEWKLGGTGLCFTCSTGENDASDDYELVVSK